MLANGVSAVTAPSPEVPEGRMDSLIQLAGLVPYWIVRVLSAADWCRRWKVNTRDAAELSCVGGIDGPASRGRRRLGDGDGPGAEGDVGCAGACLYRWR